MIINVVLTCLVLAVFAAAWTWLAVVGIPNIIKGVQEVRENWDNPNFWDEEWTHPDDLDYWDGELHRLLIEEHEPLDDWAFLNKPDESVPVYETWPDWLDDK